MTSQTKYPTEIAAGMPMAKMPALLSFLEDRSRGNVNRQRAAAVRQLHGNGGGGELGELSTRGSGWPPSWPASVSPGAPSSQRSQAYPKEA